MNDLIVKNVDVFGDTVIATQDENGVIWAGVRWMCDGIGLSRGQMNNEVTKVKEDLVLSKGARNFILPTKGGKQEALCLQLDYIPLWLAKISITPSMKENNPELVDKLVKYQLQAKDVLAKAFLSKTKRDKPKKEKLQSVNKAVSNIDRIFTKAGIEPIYIAAEAKRLYSEAGYEINIPLITDNTMQKLWDCTSIAKELGITSESGRPHDKAVSAIIQKLDIFENEVVRTAYTRNGHDGVTVQYKDSVFSKVKEWLEENGYPTVIELRLSNGNINKCRVVYRDVA